MNVYFRGYVCTLRWSDFTAKLPRHGQLVSVQTEAFRLHSDSLSTHSRTFKIYLDVGLNKMDFFLNFRYLNEMPVNTILLIVIREE